VWTTATRPDRATQVTGYAALARHAVVAIARGGAWESVPLFHAWVTPDMHIVST
jgi:hypothetical protein